MKKDNNRVQALKVNGKVNTDSKQKANVFNYHFKSIFTNEPADNLPDKGPSLHPMMEEISVTTPGIISLLQSLDIHKVSGPDGISTRFLIR